MSVAQKQVGYLNTTGFPLSYGVTYAIDSVDTFLGDFVAKLQANGLYENTLIVVASKHGQAPVDPNKYGKVNPSLIIPATGVNVSFVTVSSAFARQQPSAFRYATDAGLDRRHRTHLAR